MIYDPIGTHIIADLHGVSRNLNDRRYLEKILLESIKKSNATFEKMVCKEYKPQGITLMAIIKESHFIIHTEPEYEQCKIDLYTCGKKADPEKGLRYLINILRPKGEVNAMKITRGNIKDLEISPIRKTKSSVTTPLGYTMLLDCYDCKRWKKLNDLDSAYKFLEDLTLEIGMDKQSCPRLLRTPKEFKGKEGLSGDILIAQSGIYLHSFVKKKLLWLTVESCEKFDSDIVINFVKKVFEPKWIDDRWLLRGVDY